MKCWDEETTSWAAGPTCRPPKSRSPQDKAGKYHRGQASYCDSITMGGWIDPPHLTIAGQENKKKWSPCAIYASTCLSLLTKDKRVEFVDQFGFSRNYSNRGDHLLTSPSPRLLQRQPFCVPLQFFFSSSLNGCC